MRLGEYLEVGTKMKTARKNAGMNQREMAKLLSLTNSAYSNYENGYSEPPAEVIVQFCNVLHINLSDLLGIQVAEPKVTSIRTFAEFLSILIDLDRRGIPIQATTTYSQKDNQLSAHLTFDIENAQLASFIPDWNKKNQEFAAGKISVEEYEMWVNNVLQIYNVRIEDYIYRKQQVTILSGRVPENLL